MISRAISSSAVKSDPTSEPSALLARAGAWSVRRSKTVPSGGGDRVGIPVRALRVDVDQPHLHGAERRLELAVADQGVALDVPEVLVEGVEPRA